MIDGMMSSAFQPRSLSARPARTFASTRRLTAPSRITRRVDESRIHNGRCNTVRCQRGVDDDVNVVTELRAHLRRRACFGRTRAVGAGGGKRPDLRRDLPHHRIVGRAHPDRLAGGAGGDEPGSSSSTSVSAPGQNAAANTRAGSLRGDQRRLIERWRRRAVAAGLGAAV